MFEDVRTISNEGFDPIEIWFEPWGMSHLLPPGHTFRLVGQSPTKGKLEIGRHRNAVTIFAWTGATLQVFDGDNLIDDFTVAVPPEALPKRMSIKGFVESFFYAPPVEPPYDTEPRR